MKIKSAIKFLQSIGRVANFQIYRAYTLVPLIFRAKKQARHIGRSLNSFYLFEHF